MTGRFIALLVGVVVLTFGVSFGVVSAVAGGEDPKPSEPVAQPQSLDAPAAVAAGTIRATGSVPALRPKPKKKSAPAASSSGGGSVSPVTPVTPVVPNGGGGGGGGSGGGGGGSGGGGGGSGGGGGGGSDPVIGGGSG